MKDDKPNLLITYPKYNDRFIQEKIPFNVNIINDNEFVVDGTPTFSWVSDIDGKIGDGKSFVGEHLTAGTHNITVSSHGASAQTSIRIFDNLRDFYLSPPSQNEIDTIMQDFTIRWTPEGSWPASRPTPQDFNPSSNSPSKIVLISKLLVLEHQQFSQPLPFTNNGEGIYDHLKRYTRTIDATTGNASDSAGGGQMDMNLQISLWDPSSPPNCNPPIHFPYIHSLYVIIHENRHNMHDDPRHSNCNGHDNTLSNDDNLERGSGYAWAAMYLMWVYKYGIHDPPLVKDWAKNLAYDLLNDRFCTRFQNPPVRPTHSNPLVQNLITEILNTNPRPVPNSICFGP